MSYESALFAMDAGAYDAELLRRATFAWAARTSANQPGIIAGGLLSATDCQLSAPASGMSVNLSPGEMLIGGTEGGAQGGYGPFRIQSTTNLIISNANPTNPRIDLVCATVNDGKYAAPTGAVTVGQAAPIVITGTPTAGATLSNLLGVGSLPASSLLIGYVLVPAGATSIVTADIANKASVVGLSSNYLQLLASQKLQAQYGQNTVSVSANANPLGYNINLTSTWPTAHVGFGIFGMRPASTFTGWSGAQAWGPYDQTSGLGSLSLGGVTILNTTTAQNAVVWWYSVGY